MTNNPSVTPAIIKQALCDLSSVERTPYGFEIALPQVFASGEIVVVTVQPEAGGFLIHDGGLAAMGLEGSGIKLSSNLRDQLKAIVAKYTCEFDRSRVYKQCTVDGIAEAASVVGCAARAVADFHFQVGHAPTFDFRRQLVDSLSGYLGGPRVRENEEINSVSGSRYQVAAVVLDIQKSRPIAYVEAVSSHEAVARKFRALYDIKRTPLVGDVGRYSVYDDVHSRVTSGDLSLLSDVSTPVPYRESGRIFEAWRVQ